MTIYLPVLNKLNKWPGGVTYESAFRVAEIGWILVLNMRGKSAWIVLP